MSAYRPARLCDRCQLRLPGRHGHGFVTERHGVVHGRCPKPLASLPPDQLAALARPDEG